MIFNAGLGFHEQGKATYLFVVTSDSIDCYQTQGKEKKEELDMIGCELGCATMSEPDQDMILGRSEAVYFFGPEGRGACLVFEGLAPPLNFAYFPLHQSIQN